MTSPLQYTLDTNVFIEAAGRYYAFDIAPGFWAALIQQAHDGQLHSIDRVKAEIDRGADALKDWANIEFQQWFMSTDQTDVTIAYGQIMICGLNQAQFTTAAKAEFADRQNADAWVVAYAKAKGCVVVTHERSDPNVRRRIPIPNICLAFGVPYLDTFQLLRDLGIKLG